jgi:hypothetical protein
MTFERQLLFVLQPFRSILTNKVGPTNLNGRFSKIATHPFDPKETTELPICNRPLPGVEQTFWKLA